MDQNKKRGANFTPEQRSILIKLGNKYKNIIENKKTDGATWRSKEETWKKIENQFNSCNTGPPRTAKQLKLKYEGLKKEIKKQYTQHKAYLYGTGGGKAIPEPTPNNEEEKELTETILLSVQGLKNSFDGDAVNGDDHDSFVTEKENVEARAQVQGVNCEWNNFDVQMLQTPIHPALQLEVVHIENIQENLNDVNKNKENNDVVVEVQQDDEEDEKQTCLSRRRPLINKKRCQRAVASKFEDLAEKKDKYIDFLLKKSEDQKMQEDIRHNLKVSILEKQNKQEELRIELLEYEINIAKLKLESLNNNNTV